jgi:hypothetical protein
MAGETYRGEEREQGETADSQARKTEVIPVTFNLLNEPRAVTT